MITKEDFEIVKKYSLDILEDDIDDNSVVEQQVKSLKNYISMIEKENGKADSYIGLAKFFVYAIGGMALILLQLDKVSSSILQNSSEIFAFCCLFSMFICIGISKQKDRNELIIFLSNAYMDLIVANTKDKTKQEDLRETLIHKSNIAIAKMDSFYNVFIVIVGLFMLGTFFVIYDIN